MKGSFGRNNGSGDFVCATLPQTVIDTTVGLQGGEQGNSSTGHIVFVQ